MMVNCLNCPFTISDETALGDNITAASAEGKLANQITANASTLSSKMRLAVVLFTVPSLMKAQLKMLNGFLLELFQQLFTQFFAYA